MYKYILGAIVGASLVVGGYAVAASTDMQLVDSFKPISTRPLVKIYDSAANVVCYVYAGNGVSCLKNI